MDLAKTTWNCFKLRIIFFQEGKNLSFRHSHDALIIRIWNICGGQHSLCRSALCLFACINLVLMPTFMSFVDDFTVK